MATQQRLDTIREQLEERIFTATGKIVSLEPKEYTVSNRLSWMEVMARFEDGDPINEGELLPNIPEDANMTASTFYRATEIPLTMFAKLPFSSFEKNIAGTRKIEKSPSPEPEEIAAVVEHFNMIEKEVEGSYGEAGVAGLDLGVTAHGPDLGLEGFIGMLPGIGNGYLAVRGVTSGMMGVISQSLGGRLSGYEAYAQLDTTEAAIAAYNRGEINDAQLAGMFMEGPGKFGQGGYKTTGEQWTFDGVKLDQETITAIQNAATPAEQKSILNEALANIAKNRDIMIGVAESKDRSWDNVISSIMQDLEDNYNRGRGDTRSAWDKMFSGEDPNTGTKNSGIPPSVIGAMFDWSAKGVDQVTNSLMFDKDGLVWDPVNGWYAHTGVAFGGAVTPSRTKAQQHRDDQFHAFKGKTIAAI